MSDARNSFESSIRGTIYINLFNAEVTKAVTSLLRCLCSSLAQDTLSHGDPSYHYFFSEVLPFSDREEYGREECGGLYWAGAFSKGSSQGFQVDEG